MEHLTREISVKKSGNSYYLSIPKDFEKNFEFEDGVKYEFILTLFELDEKGFLTEKIKNLRLISKISPIGLRPKELADLKYSDIDLDYNLKPYQIRHRVYKAKNTIHNKSLHYHQKEVLKVIHSDYLKEQLIMYMQKHPKYEQNKLFPWTTSDSLHKAFVELRKKAKKNLCELNFMLDTITKTLIIKGQPFTQYRISPYSLRRFAFTYHYYITYNKDFVKLSKEFGHSRPETTLQYYIMPKESIGLTDNMIEHKINLDDFIKHKGQRQMIIPDFSFDDIKARFRKFGQLNLSHFINPC
jgi:integrase